MLEVIPGPDRKFRTVPGVFTVEVAYDVGVVGEVGAVPVLGLVTGGLMYWALAYPVRPLYETGNQPFTAGPVIWMDPPEGITVRIEADIVGPERRFRLAVVVDVAGQAMMVPYRIGPSWFCRNVPNGLVYGFWACDA